MVKKTLLIMTIAVLALVPAILAEHTYVVLNVMGETVSVGSWLEPLNNDVLTVGSMPNQIYVAGSENNVFCVCSGSATVEKLIVTSTTASLEEAVNFPTGSNPYMACKHQGRTFASLNVTGELGIWRNSSGGSLTVSEPFCTGPQGVFAHEDYAYVTASNFDPIDYTYGQGKIWRLTNAGVVVDHLDIGMNPQQIIEGPDENMHIICTGDYMTHFGMVYIVDKDSFTIIDSLYLGGNPGRLACDDETGIVYSCTSVWGTSGSGKLLAYNGITHEVIFTAESSGNTLAGTGLNGLDAYDGYVYIPSFDSAWVEIVSHEGTTVTPYEIYDAGSGAFDCVIIPDESNITENPVPETFEIVTAYPNPFNSSCHIDAPENSTITIHNIQGKSIAQLNGNTWSPRANLPSGIYTARVEHNGNITEKKVVYIQ